MTHRTNREFERLRLAINERRRRLSEGGRSRRACGIGSFGREGHAVGGVQVSGLPPWRVGVPVLPDDPARLAC